MAPLHVKKHSKAIGVKLPSFQKWVTWSVLSIVAISGMWWTLLHDWMASEADDLMHQLIVVHGAAAFFSLMVFGALMPQHIRIAWQGKRNRGSGSAMTAVLAMIILTGLGLYYGPEEWRDTTKWMHVWIGVSSVVVIVLHVWFGKKSAKMHVYQSAHPQPSQEVLQPVSQLNK